MKKIKFLLPIFFVAIQINAQNSVKESISISWFQPSMQLIKSDTIKHINFDKAVLNFQYSKSIPLYFYQIQLGSNQKIISAELKNQKYIPLSVLEKSIIEKSNQQLKNTNEIFWDYSTSSKIDFANFYIQLLRKNLKTNQIEKLVSFDLEYNIIEDVLNKNSYENKTNIENSVLASGNWYKLKVNKNGVYKLTYSDLSKMGIDLGNPKNIRIYGNGNGMLPEKNTDFRYDDLIENAIHVQGEEDGVFNPNDYVLFYGQSPIKWVYNKVTKRMEHITNYYSDYTYYYVTTSLGEGKRIKEVNSLESTPNAIIDSYMSYTLHEIDTLNLIKSGKTWYGEKFDNQLTYNYHFSFNNLKNNKNINAKIAVAARSLKPSSFNLKFNNINSNLSVAATPDSYTSEFAINQDKLFTISNSNTLDLSITYNKTTTESIGWLNYIEINSWHDLIFNNNQLNFRNPENVYNSSVCEYKIQNANNNLIFWNITNPREIFKQKFNLNDGIANFISNNDSLQEYIAFSNVYYSPTLVGNVKNQNLHGFTNTNYIMIVYPDFLSAAERLANFHRTKSGLNVEIVTPEQIYNEFSSGKQDLAAIRDFLKHVWESNIVNGEASLKYVLLFGDASYDYKNKLSNNTNFVPTFQSNNSLHITYSVVTDDFFGLFDNHEGYDGAGTVDIGIGRILANSSNQAEKMVDKILRYVDNDNNSAVSIFENFNNDWKNSITFVGDDQDSGIHMKDADRIATKIDTSNIQFNIDKIYLDAFKQYNTPGGQRYPDVKNAINAKIKKGTLIMNYIGHGGEDGWAHEEILRIDDINSWTNSFRQPLFLTATCEFTRFDDPLRTSAGELVFLNENGGAVAMITSSRIAYSSNNFSLVNAFYNNVFNKTNGKYKRIGDLIKMAKVANGGDLHLRNFVLLGDPAMKLSIPEYNIIIEQFPDTIKAFSNVIVKGRITNIGDTSIASDFNGFLYTSLYDKATNFTTLQNDPESGKHTFKIQKNIIYKGKTKIENGKFEFSFVLPKDIQYFYGNGKLSLYADGTDKEASGAFKNFIIGGSEQNFQADDESPKIRLFMNDSNFVNGGTTNQNPYLYCILHDNIGINTTGNGVGHDIVATLDGNNNQVYVLNEYFVPMENNSNSGYVLYPFQDLAEGKHTLQLKVWDIYNNSSTAEIEFYVYPKSQVYLSNVLNYPNPFKSSTIFSFEHNQSEQNIDATIQIYSLSGQLVRTIEEKLYCSSFNSQSITWDGTNQNGEMLEKGIYIYKLKITNNQGVSTEKTQKLVIIK